MKNKKLSIVMFLIWLVLTGLAVWMVLRYEPRYIPTLHYYIISLIIVAVLSGVFWWKRKSIIRLPYDSYQNRRLIWDLAKADFKARYASSYLGTFWAFVQPVITVAIYVFVFQFGFRAGATSSGYPYLLYLVGGICPWFFFSEAWMSATGCLVDYSYLVKKVVFKIDVLPMIKILSSLFIHFFFIGLVLFLYIVNGRIPNLTIIQLVYYMFAMICLVLALSYLSAAITPFFHDARQIISIITQLGIWTIPIMYDENAMPEMVMRVLKLNPMYYIVSGYRDCFMQGTWVVDRLVMTVWYWLVVIILLIIGTRLFKKLKVHFADVL